MKLKLSIKQKLQINIISVTAIFIISAILYISYKIKNTAIENAKNYTQEVVSKYATQIEIKLNNDISIIRTLAQTATSLDIEKDTTWKPLIKKMYVKVLSNNKQFDDIWDSWELSYIDKNWKKSYGRYCITAYSDIDAIRIEEEYKSMEGDTKQYARLKSNNNENIEEPYLFSFTGNQSESVLITDITVPINDSKGNYRGVVGADIRLERLQAIVNKIKPYENSAAYLISNKGFYTSHPNPEMIGKEAKKDFNIANFSIQIQKGKKFSFINTSIDGEEYYYIFSPINIGNTNTPWSIGIKVPLESIVKDAIKEGRSYTFFGFIILIMISLVIALIARKITRPLRKISTILSDLSEGKVSQTMITSYKTGDEIEAISIALNKSISGLESKSKFAEKIGQNELGTQLELLSENDILGKSLVEMQNSLTVAQNKEFANQEEERKRTWANEGLAKFSDIFRINNNSIQELSTVFTKSIIKYCNANQGTLFLNNEGIYESKATYAYDRDKFQQTEIKPGEGLIGSCILEKKSIYLTDVPNGYTKITSGLGDATPKYLFISPIQTDKEIIGVFEMASFNEIETYQRTFIETICTNLAGVIEYVNINENTKMLLEQTQQQAEEMKAQEEEMRQNLEELQATQEEIANKSIEINGVINALNASSLVLRMDMLGNVTDVNQSFLDLLELPKEALIGKNFSEISELAKDEKAYSAFWENLKNGVAQKQEMHLQLSNGVDLWLSQVFSTIFDENNEPVSIMNISVDITQNKIQEEKLQEQNEEMASQEEMMLLNMEEFEQVQAEVEARSEEMNALLDAMNQANFLVEYNIEGNVIEINDSYLEFLGITKDEALNYKQTDNFNNHDKNFWKEILKGKVWKGHSELKINNQTFTLIEAYTPVRNSDGEIYKVFKLANNIKDFEV